MCRAAAGSVRSYPSLPPPLAADPLAIAGTGLALCRHTRRPVVPVVGRVVRALEAFDNAVRLDPKSAYAHEGRARTLHRLGRHKEAAEAIESAIRIDKNYPGARALRREIRRDMG